MQQNIIKKEWIQTQATTWTNLQNIMLSQRNQVTKGHIVNESLSMNCPKRRETKYVRGGLGLGEGEGNENAF